MCNDSDYFKKLVELMDTLREPNGCPWDREQTRETLMPMLIEETYEVLEALDGDDPDELCEELGDLLFQVIFHSRISKERGEFDAHEVCRRAYEKMVGRHPHVFGDVSFADAQELLKNWEDIKAAEKHASGRTNDKRSLLDGVPEKLPRMYEAVQITAKASRVGFDWKDVSEIAGKMSEELEELRQALAEKHPERVKEEVGDVIFTALNIARFLSVDPETALKRANDKFALRFRQMEQHFSNQGRSLKEIPVDEMESFWQAAKSTE